MSTHVSHLLWHQEDSRLYLRVDHRRALLPPMLSELLLGNGGHGLTDDPANDLLRLELDLRRYARHVASNASDAAEEVAYGGDAITLAIAEDGMIGRRRCRMAFEYFAVAAMLHMTWTNRHRCVRTWISQVRQFVIDARVPEGLLAAAAAGWQRRPDVPSFVDVFTSTSAFVSDNTDRADPTWWAYRSDVAGGVQYGDLWRRDGDDDDPTAAPLPRSGPWRLAYLSRTGEVYAVRRAGRRPEEVWLLGTGFTNETEIRSILNELQDHMREPNSLILAAQAVHAAECQCTTSDVAKDSLLEHDCQAS